MNAPTDEQRAVIDLPADRRALVIAGPGTGKTYTLIERSVRLGAGAGSEILVLSFTRAVIAEIRRRAAEAGGARISASTIDGYAARLVLSVGGELAGGFDQSIRLARKLVPDLPSARWPEHILVDEIQDLVPPRLEFVRLLLERATAGFTAFGDPRQAIYEFEAPNSSPPGVDTIRAMAGVEELRLTKTHRAKVGALLEACGDARGSELLARARPVTTLAQLKLLMGKGNATLLTRTNGEALAMADALSALGLDGLIRQESGALGAPDWIARFAMAAPQAQWTRKSANGTLETLTDAPPATEAWRALRRIASDGGDGVSLERLRLAVGRAVSYDDELRTASGVISTIHRAKGLEWDQIVVLEPAPVETVSDEEDRVAFVAATRARKELWRMTRPDFGGRLIKGPKGRWELRSWAGRTVAIEVRVGDAARDRPYAHPGRPAPDVQEALESVLASTPVVLHRENDGYVIVVEHSEIGEMTSEFFAAVASRWRTPPPLLTGARVLAKCSFAGDPAVTDAAGLGGTGLWVGVELTGLVRTERTGAGR